MSKKLLKALSLTAVLFILIMSVVVLSSCDEDDNYSQIKVDGEESSDSKANENEGSGNNVSPDHVDTWTLVETVDPTCTEEGYTLYKCEECGKTNKLPTAATGHTITEEVLSEATCTDDGELKRSCPCGFSEIKPITAPGHVAVPTPDVAPTCKDEGSTGGEHCSVCNTVITEPTPVDKVAHEFVMNLTTVPNCQVEGIMTTTCANCDYLETENTGYGGHNEEPMADVPPTCVDNGTTGGVHCTICGEIIVEPEEVPATTHFFKTTTTAPTCVSAGKTVYECYNCDMEYEKAGDPATGIHTYEDGVCTVCGEEESVEDEDEQASVGLLYEMINDSMAYRVTGRGECTDVNIVIPEIYEGLPVTEIGEKAFYGCADVISIKLPDSIAKIADKAFSECDALQNIQLPENVEIGTDVFRGSIYVVIVIKHDVEFVPAKEATCTEPGNIAYYWCPKCNIYYEDEKETTRIYDVIIPNSHNFVGGSCTKCGAVQDEVLITDVAEIAHLGKFALGTLENAIGLPEMINVQTKDGRIHAVPVLWNLQTYNKSEAGEYTIYGHIQAAGFHFAAGVDSKVEAKVEIVDFMKGTADIVFVLDVSGSMSDEVANVKNNVVEFSKKLEEAGVSARWSAVTYSDYTEYPSTNIKEQTTILQNGATPWFSTASDYKAAINSIQLAIGGDTPEVAVDGLMAANTLEHRKDARVFYILLTDANYKVNNHYGVGSMSEATEILKDDGVNVSVITSSSYYNTYRDLTEETGGILCNINGNFANDLFNTLVPIIYEDVIS